MPAVCRANPLLLLSLLALCPACDDTPSARTSISYTTFSIGQSGREWAHDVSYTSGDGPPELTIDGVIFELRDPRSYLLDFDSIGIRGFTVENPNHAFERPDEPCLLLVADRPVELREGRVLWGGEDLGPVASGARVVVDGGQVILPES